ncbi:MAG: hypothetical protein OIF57_11740 [Marinobacterium sp.]|nr:hypothetical protein [Marinobacterium sp.]
MFYLDHTDFGLDELIEALEGKEKELPYALKNGINRTARMIKEAQEAEIKRVFDNPTRWTQNSVFVKGANEKNLEATVWLKDHADKGTPAADYLAAHIDGGPRNIKGSEYLMRKAGILHPSRHSGYTVLGEGARKNKSGNMSVGQYQKVLSNLNVQSDNGVTSNSGPGTHEYFARRRKSRRTGAPAGVYRRMKGTKVVNGRRVQKIKPVLVFVRKPLYKAIYDFYGVAEREASQHLVSNVLDALDWARANPREK